MGQVLQLASVALALLSALGALAAAIAAWRTAAILRHTAAGELLNELLREYKAPAMRDAVRRLRSKAADVGNWVDEWWKAVRTGDAEALAYDEDRHRVNGFFNRVADLDRAGMLTEKALIVLLQQRGINVWYRVVEPMTLKIDPNVRDSPFEVLRERWRKYGYHQLLSPVGPAREAVEQAAATDGAPRRS